MANYQRKQWPLPPSHMRPSPATLTSRLWNPHSYISCHCCAWGQTVACGMGICFLLTLDPFPPLGMEAWDSREVPFPAVSETDRQTAQDEPLLSAELGLILLTSGIKPSGHLHGLVALSSLGADWGLLGPFHPAVMWPRPSCARPVLTSALPETGKIWRLFVLTK